MAAKVILNKVEIQNRYNRVLTEDSYKDLAYRNAKTRFDFAQEDLLEDFDKHEITKELLEGPTAENSILPKGNLTSFLGIPNSAVVVAKIRHKLKSLIKMDKTPEVKISSKKVMYKFDVNVPPIKDLSVPSPWSSKGIVELIEDGVTNIIAFIYFSLFKKSSRSGHGLQNKNIKTRGSGRVLGIPYLSEILEKFKAAFPK